VCNCDLPRLDTSEILRYLICDGET
jgi:hypothetical protein